MATHHLCHLVEDRIGGPGLLVGRLPDGRQLFVQRLRKARGQPRLWEAFTVLDLPSAAPNLPSAADVICRAVKAMTEEAQTDDP